MRPDKGPIWNAVSISPQLSMTSNGIVYTTAGSWRSSSIAKSKSCFGRRPLPRCRHGTPWTAQPDRKKCRISKLKSFGRVGRHGLRCERGLFGAGHERAHDDDGHRVSEASRAQSAESSLSLSRKFGAFASCCSHEGGGAGLSGWARLKGYSHI